MQESIRTFGQRQPTARRWPAAAKICASQGEKVFKKGHIIYIKTSV